MPSQPTLSQSTEMPLSRQEWELLVRLPRRVLVAATSAERDSGKHTVSEGLAGIESIAAGRASGSRFVQQVVAAIYAEQDAADDEAPAAEEFRDPAVGIAAVLEEARAAIRILNERMPLTDARAYGHWLLSIATTVCEAARSGGFLGLGGVPVSPAEQRFLDDLRDALRLIG
jgi:hypothetical protein